jgi:hypothetical protein
LELRITLAAGRCPHNLVNPVDYAVFVLNGRARNQRPATTIRNRTPAWTKEGAKLPRSA